MNLLKLVKTADNTSTYLFVFTYLCLLVQVYTNNSKFSIFLAANVSAEYKLLTLVLTCLCVYMFGL